MGSIQSMELVAEGFQNVVNELYEVCAQWQRMPESFINDVDKMEHDFPFDSCLDEKVYGIALWLSDFKAEIVKWRRKNSPTLTVGELKEVIKILMIMNKLLLVVMNGIGILMSIIFQMKLVNILL